MTPAHSTPEQFGALMRGDAQRWARGDQGPEHHRRLMWAAARSAMTPRMDIVIVGAGIGGLAAAASLLQRGHRVRVSEQAPRLGEVGAGIQMSANAVKVLDHLGSARRRSSRRRCGRRRSSSAASTPASCCTACRWASSTSSATARRTSRSTAATCTTRCRTRCRASTRRRIVLDATATALDERDDGATVPSTTARSAHAELRGRRRRHQVDRAQARDRRRQPGVHRPGRLALHGADRAHRARAAHRHRVDHLVRPEEPRGDLLPAQRRVAQLRRLRRARGRRRVMDRQAAVAGARATTTPAGTRWCAP